MEHTGGDPSVEETKTVGYLIACLSQLDENKKVWILLKHEDFMFSIDEVREWDDFVAVVYNDTDSIASNRQEDELPEDSTT